MDATSDRPRRPVVRVIARSALVLLVVVLAAAAAVGTFLGTRHLRAPDAEGPGPSVPATYRGATSTPGTLPSPSAPPVRPAALAAAVGPALAASGLGTHVLARVVDVASGTVLLDRSGTTATSPASTAKLVTAAAVLTVRPATYRIATTAVAGADGTVVLVGGGDPTLSAAPAGTDPQYPGAARLSDLAAQVRKAGVTARRVLVDDAAFTGPSVSPDWVAEDVPSDYGAAITAVLADGGRPEPGAAVRSATPDLDAGRSFARLLGVPSVPVARGSAPAGARTVGTVRSAPVATLVEQMLLESDNVIAEAMARQVAIARRAPASFAGAAAAVRAVVPAAGTGLVDGSGLARGDRLSPSELTEVLRGVARSPRPAVRSLFSGLPVAAWSGSLAPRFHDAASRPGAGDVRAKTGTLTGVSALAGYARTAGGRLVTFSLVADRTGSTPAAEAALDAVAARIAACPCR